MAAETGALEQMLLLTRGVFGSNLLAINALNGKTLQSHKTHREVIVSIVLAVAGWFYYPDTRNTDFAQRTLSSSLARNSTNAA